MTKMMVDMKGMSFVFKKKKKKIKRRQPADSHLITPGFQSEKNLRSCSGQNNAFL